MKDRFQIIGASEIAGIVKEYSANLFAENLISETISQKLEAMPNYLETRYSLGKKLMLNREQFEKFQVNYNGEKKLIKTKDATQTAKVLNRGKSLEEAVKDNYFISTDWFCEPKITESQTAKDKIIKNCKFPFRATIDYLYYRDVSVNWRAWDSQCRHGDDGDGVAISRFTCGSDCHFITDRPYFGYSKDDGEC